jgi:uncharacterized protein
LDIPYEKLSPETLTAVIEEFVTREGTDYGDREWNLQQKIEQVRLLLKSGRAKIMFDDETETCNIFKVDG